MFVLYIILEADPASSRGILVSIQMYLYHIFSHYLLRIEQEREIDPPEDPED